MGNWRIRCAGLSPVSGARVADEEQNENHTDEGDQSRGNHDSDRRMDADAWRASERFQSIRKRDSADARTSATEAADGSYGSLW